MGQDSDDDPIAHLVCDCGAFGGARRKYLVKPVHPRKPRNGLHEMLRVIPRARWLNEYDPSPHTAEATAGAEDACAGECTTTPLELV